MEELRSASLLAAFTTLMVAAAIFADIAIFARAYPANFHVIIMAVLVVVHVLSFVALTSILEEC